MASIPDPVLDTLRCLKCNNFLSCKPISVTVDGQSICGRCRRPNEPMVRAHAYECVADYFLFPCKNWVKHCAYLLSIKDVSDHESKCPYGGSCSLMCFNPGALCKSDNKLDLSQGLKFYNVPDEDVLTTLTCTLCGYYLSSVPIHINPEGMSICHRCYRTKDSKVPANYIRHMALEYILEIFLFPCIYRKRGCTKVFKFGLDYSHEHECSYSKTQKVVKTFTEPNGKQKGVIETHTGHMYGTITPNSQFFVAQNKLTNDNYNKIEPIKVVPTQKQERFFNELIKHRDSLHYQWRSSKIDGPYPAAYIDATDNLYRNDQNQYKSNLSSISTPLDEANEEDRFNFRESPDSDTFERLESKDSFRNQSPSKSSSSEWTLNSRESTISSRPGGNRSPLKLNANDLMNSSSFNYPERRDNQQGIEGYADNRKKPLPHLHHNSSFKT